MSSGITSRFRRALSIYSLLKKDKKKPATKTQLFKIYLSLCAGLVMFFLVIEQSDLVQDTEKKFQDLVLYLTPAEEPYDRNGARVERPTLVAFDDASYQNIGRPAFMPREYLATVLSEFRQHNANKTLPPVRFLTLDFDLSINDAGIVSEDLHASDHKLLLELQEISSSTLLFVSRSFAHYFDEGDGTGGSMSVAGGYLPVWDNGPFDAFVKTSEQAFYMSTGYALAGDGNVREWRSFELVCQDDRVKWIPSAQLLIGTAQKMLHHNSNKKIAAHIQAEIERINDFTQQFNCQDLNEQKEVFSPRQKYTYLCLQAKQDCIDSWYFSPSSTDKFTLSGDTELQRFFSYYTPPGTNGKFQSVLLQSTRSLIEEGWRFPPATFSYIAATYADSSDWHKIPMVQAVEVPGVYLILNSAFTLQKFGVLKPAPVIVKVVLLLLAIVITAYCFTCYSRTKALILSIAILSAIIIPFSFYTLSKGIVLEVSIIVLCLEFFIPVVDALLDAINFIIRKRSSHA